MPYCIYLRKSRLDIDIDNNTIEETLIRHHKVLVELGKKLGLEITQVYKEVVSGETISQRPLMQKLLYEVEKKVWEGVLVIEIERLARGDTVDQGIVAQTFKYSSTKIITPTKIYNPNNEFDEEYFEFGLFMSRREYKTINRRLQKGRLASVKEGKYVGNQAPYGYVRKKILDNKGYMLKPHPEEADVVKIIYKLYTQGELQPNGNYKKLGVSLICKKLNLLSIKPRKSEYWSSSSIRDIIINPVYNGKIRWNNRPVQKKIVEGKSQTTRPRSSSSNCIIVDGLHPSIVDENTWKLAQSIMKSKSKNPTPSNYILKNPLSGIVICGVCKRKMVRRPIKNKEKDAVLMCPSSGCSNVSSKLYIVEKQIISTLEVWLKSYKLTFTEKNSKNDISCDIHIYLKSIKNINAKIAKIESQINKLQDLLEQGVYSKDTFLKRLKILSDKIKHLEYNKNIIENKIIIIKKYKKNNKNIDYNSKFILDIYNKTNVPKLKNDLLKEVIEKVLYTKTVNTRWSNTPDTFEIDVYPKLPCL